MDSWTWKITNREWMQDEDGWYWIGDLYYGMDYWGKIGNWESIDERLPEKPKDDNGTSRYQ